MQQMNKMGIHQSIESFEQVFEDMDVKTEEMNAALDNVYSSTVDESEVSQLIEQVKDMQGLNANEGIAGANQAPIAG